MTEMGAITADEELVSRARSGPRSGLWRRARKHMVMQREVAECGLACCAILARHFGHGVDLPWMRQHFGTSVKGVSLARIRQVLVELDLSVQPLRADAGYFERAAHPAILHWEGRHFVVFLGSDRGRLIVADPALGVRRLTPVQFAAGFSGVFLQVTRAERFEAKVFVQVRAVAPVIAALKGFKAPFVRCLCLAFLVEALGLALPLQMQWTLDHSATGRFGPLPAIALAFGALVVAQNGLAWFKGWLMGGLAASLNEEWTGRLTRHLFRLPAEFFARRHIGDIAAKFVSLRFIQMHLTSGAVEALLNGFFGMLALLALSHYSGIMALAVAGVMGIYAAGRKVALERLQRLSAQQVRTGAQHQTELVETIQGMATIQLAGMEGRRSARMHSLVVDTASHERALMRTNAMVASAGQGVLGLVRVGLICWGTVLLARGVFSPGMLVAAVAFSEVFNSRVTMFVDRLMETLLLRVHVEEVSDIASAKPGAHHEGTDGLPDGPLAVELVNVGFRYSPSESWVIRNFSAYIEPGESVAITGPSGCGKTTLARLLLGLLEPTEGEVRVGGINIFNAGLAHYRKRVGAVLQDDCLFTGSIAENISFFDPDAALDDVQAAAALAAMDDDIRSMPMKYQTMVGEQGSGLSGGQRQRILLARALYRAPQLLVLDEATSSLDAANESAISQSVQGLPMTRVMIAHRKETIATAGRVIDLSAEVGPGLTDP